jgi:hemin uptake protein HemP
VSAAAGTDAPREPGTPAKPRVLTSAELLRGAREVAILHAGETYRLRLTRNDKLILTK